MMKPLVLGVLTLSLAGCGGHCHGHSEEDKEAGEIKVTREQLPPAVRATLDKEAKDGKITDIDKETTKSGKTVYEADVVIDGKNYEIKIAEDGALIGKKLDNEEDEKKNGKD